VLREEYVYINFLPSPWHLALPIGAIACYPIVLLTVLFWKGILYTARSSAPPSRSGNRKLPFWAEFIRTASAPSPSVSGCRHKFFQSED
jgi:hypothetical protein